MRGHRDPSFGRVSDTKRHKLPSRRREPASLGPPACRTLRSMRNPARQPDEPGQRLGEADDMLPGYRTQFQARCPSSAEREVSTSRIGTQLRAADGENCRASSTATGRKRWSVSDMSICCLTQPCASGPRPYQGRNSGAAFGRLTVPAVRENAVRGSTHPAEARPDAANLLRPAPDGTEIRSTGSFDVRFVRFGS